MIFDKRFTRDSLLDEGHVDVVADSRVDAKDDFLLPFQDEEEFVSGVGVLGGRTARCIERSSQVRVGKRWSKRVTRKKGRKTICK